MDICKTFNKGTVNEKTALNHLNLEVKDGDFITIIGSNGAGKSTMFNAICGGFYVDEGFVEDRILHFCRNIRGQNISVICFRTR